MIIKKRSVDRGLHTRFHHGTNEVRAQGHSNGDELSEALRVAIGWFGLVILARAVCAGRYRAATSPSGGGGYAHAVGEPNREGRYGPVTFR